MQMARRLEESMTQLKVSADHQQDWEALYHNLHRSQEQADQVQATEV